ncbi:MAG: Gfo/Idh/MocA family protein, partial [Vicinamibacterales bacterium]
PRPISTVPFEEKGVYSRYTRPGFMISPPIAVIGCGRIVQLVHLNVLTALKAEVVALADPDAEHRQAVKRRASVKARVVADYEEVLAMPDVDAVVICAPPAVHAEIAIAAFAKKKHVYLEKPLATSLDEAARVIRAWKDAGVVGMIGFNYRFNPLYAATRRHIAADRVGALVAARTVFSTPARELPEWKRARASGGGVLLDLASHHLDLIRFLFQEEIRIVCAEVRSQRSEADTAIVQLQLANGLLVQSLFSFNTVDEDRFELYGDKGRLTVDRYRSWDADIVDTGTEFSLFGRAARALRPVLHARRLLRKWLASGYEPSYGAALGHFIDAVRNKRAATPDLVDGYRSLAIVQAIERSAQARRPVMVPEGSG